LLDHAAPSAIAPVGADLRVVARVRMATPGRGVANLRVAMRVTVTEQDEDERSIARAVRQAVRTLVLVALLLAAMIAGAQRSGPLPARTDHVESTAARVAAVAADATEAADAAAWRSTAGGGDAPAPGEIVRSRPDTLDSSPATGLGADETALGAMDAVHAVVPPPAPRPAGLAVDAWSPVVAASQRTPRPALAASVIPSPD
jgi:hypothetical protein